MESLALNEIQKVGENIQQKVQVLAKLIVALICLTSNSKRSITTVVSKRMTSALPVKQEQIFAVQEPSMHG